MVRQFHGRRCQVTHLAAIQSWADWAQRHRHPAVNVVGGWPEVVWAGMVQCVLAALHVAALGSRPPEVVTTGPPALRKVDFSAGRVSERPQAWKSTGKEDISAGWVSEQPRATEIVGNLSDGVPELAPSDSRNAATLRQKMTTRWQQAEPFFHPLMLQTVLFGLLSGRSLSVTISQTQYLNTCPPNGGIAAVCTR